MDSLDGPSGHLKKPTVLQTYFLINLPPGQGRVFITGFTKHRLSNNLEKHESTFKEGLQKSCISQMLMKMSLYLERQSLRLWI